MKSDHNDEVTWRLLIKGCQTAPWLSFRLNKVTQPYDPYQLKVEFLNSINIKQSQATQVPDKIVSALYESRNTELLPGLQDTREFVMLCRNGEEVISTGQHRLGRNHHAQHSHGFHSETIYRRQSSTHRNSTPHLCCNCERQICTVRRCPKHKDFDYICHNHSAVVT